ncbi:indolepyruvate ferredoxin oxidoreductase family protein [Phreatobacter stygius]|uniref:Indolepyruvate ferredoxin oxidoreductase family protein n=1 Tax=Phreatobacter stygius TaxID=1940610 RepID=A0A4D7BA96_9HYPH|nr:indolepyruvate ferredoxin oxidoreductase family protein [Phreatobacter stygius]QCI67068.1 indolepyruvate ferredoxin oxidoreductase family protein [Phreatobacter stygius]
MDGPAATRLVTLDDKYTADEGRIYLTGVQALVRLPLVQRRLDRAAGLNTAGFISGYRGSPLGTYDRELWAAKRHLAKEDVVFQPGLNEDLAATSVWGSQQIGLSPGAKHDGVFAIWYAKSPGVDRSGDVLKHANAAGTAPSGGVLAIAGDDHACKSASLPSQSDYAFLDASIPVLHPANVAEVLRFGLVGLAMSRATGLWVGMKALADTMDSAAAIDLAEVTPVIVTPDGLPSDVSIRWPDSPLEQERRLFDLRLPAAIAFGRANGLNRVLADPGPDRRRLTILAVGKSRLDVEQALGLLGLDLARLADLGVGLAAIGMPWPLDPDFVREVAAGADEVLVIEEKRPLVEDQVARTLLTLEAGQRPRLAGKIDHAGKPLLSPRAAFTADHLARVIGGRLAGLGDAGTIAETIAPGMAKLGAAPAAAEPALARRLPFFCSGCPHNRSTVVPEGSRALAGIGCHYMAQWMDRDTSTFTQMGGEGASWIGQAPFTETPHVFVNLGDGTYAHSGLLAIRAAIAAGVTITYKLLYNDAVAMTGGQTAEGGFSVAQIAHQLSAEGVGQIRIVAEEPERHRGAAMPTGVTIDPRDRLEAVQRELREVKGISVLIYDQVCAAEKRRRRKRGLMPDAGRRVVINEAVCEGCGDCGKKSNCVSIVPLETEFGRKRRIDQTSCNQDATCVEGFCPSFVTVEGGLPRKPEAATAKPPEVPAPAIDLDRPARLVVGGIGGTGIVTIGAIIGMAAHLDGRGVSVMDQIGLAQKGGEVTTHIRIAGPIATGPVRLARGEAETLIGCDLAVASSPEVLPLIAEGALAIVNDHVVMTGDFTARPDLVFPDQLMKRRLAARGEVVFADLSMLATHLLGDAVGANMMALGLAWQKGRVPVTEAAILQAIELNGAAVVMNKAAFAWGRALGFDRIAVEARLPRGGEAVVATDLDRLVEIRASALVAYQDEALAARFRALVIMTAAAEARVAPGSTALAEAVAKSFHKLLAYKDEYEVARLHVETGFLDRLAREFDGGRVAFHLAPPLFARLDPVTGEPRKMRFGSWMIPAFKLLARLKGLRGSFADPFGRTAERRMERRLIEDYEALVRTRLLPELTSANHPLALEIATLPLSIRGFGHVKAQAERQAAARRDALLARWPGLSTASVAAE